MSTLSSAVPAGVTSTLAAFTWTPQPEPARFVLALLDDCLRSCSFAARLSHRMLDETGTRLLDWIDHFALPVGDPALRDVERVGYVRALRPTALPYSNVGSQSFPLSSDRHGHAADTDDFSLESCSISETWEHPKGLFPRIRSHSGTVRHLAIKVESIVDFLAAHGLWNVEIDGHPNASLRRACLAKEDGVELWAVERHASLAFEPYPYEVVPLAELARHLEAFRLRRRDFETDAEGFAHAQQLVDAAIADLGRDRTCELFFIAEREYWLRRNRAGRIQKARQDVLGLGWANHDHHTYRSSRHCFSLLIAFLERLGFVCRERFYAGREAGWGAQVIEHAATGITIFADVDMSPEELAQDFSHEPLPPRDRLGTVGLWCGLHGEAFLQAGLHHLECQFDFSATRDQLKLAGIDTMPPFTDFAYLRQAFTRGE